MKSISDELYRTIVLRVKEARIAAPMSQEALAAKMGKPQNFISKIERYERRMDVAEFLRITRIIGVDPRVIIQDVDNESIPSPG